LNSLGDHLGDGLSDDIVDFFIDSLAWVLSHLNGSIVEELRLDTETFVTVALTSEGLVSLLRILFAQVTMEAQWVSWFVSSLGHESVGLRQLTGKLVVIVSLSLDAVSSGTITGIAGSLLDVCLLLESWDDGLSNMAWLVGGIDSISILINQLLSSSSRASDAEDLSFLEAIGILVFVSEETISEILLSNGVNTICSETFSKIVLIISILVKISSLTWVHVWVSNSELVSFAFAVVSSCNYPDK
jgi:hypothetical protein